MSTHHAARRSAVSVLIAAFLVAIIHVLPVAANSTAQALPFSQAWTNTGQITLSDSWSGVPGIVGYRGDGLASPGIDPQQVTVASDVVDVNANETDPDTYLVGGVTEFDGLSDPVVALRGSSTADAPSIVLNLDTTGLIDIHVAYYLRDIDGSARDAFQAVALQYRVGTTGLFTNVPAGYVEDATTGPNLATLVTPVSVTLPAAANDKPAIQVRVITTDAITSDPSGQDEWVGIDDIVVTGTGDEAPVVQSTTPTKGATGVAVGSDISVTFSEPVNVTGTWFTVSCSTSDGHTATATGGPTTFTIDPDVDFASSEDCTVTILAAGVTDQDAVDPPDGMAVDRVFGFTTEVASSPPTVDAGGRYTVVEGGSVLVAATGVDPDGQALTYAWDLDGDGVFEAPGQSVTFSAAGIEAPATRTIRVRATDPDGLSAIDATTVDVVWAFDTFRRPIDAGAPINEANAGSTIPVKFSLDGNQGLDLFALGRPASAQYECGTTPPTDANELAQTSGPGGFRYGNSNDEYVFEWKTDKAWRDSCRVFVLGLKDGTTHNVLFHFK